jgi:dipeptidyl aminopeptidase/acylaminoacyl peptidase
LRLVDLQLKQREPRLQGWALLPSESEGYPLVVLCHGIPGGEAVEGDPGYQGLAGELARHGFASVFFNLRGTGYSGGDFSLGGWVEDLGRVLDLVFGDRLFRGADRERVVLWGYSGGGATAVIRASLDRRPAAVVSMAAPDGLDALVPREGVGEFIRHCRTVGIIRGRDRPGLEEEVWRDIVENRPVERIRAVSPIPLLIVHGLEDETVPVGCARRLYEAAGEPRELVLLERGRHRLRLNPAATAAALSWLRRVLPA